MLNSSESVAGVSSTELPGAVPTGSLKPKSGRSSGVRSVDFSDSSFSNYSVVDTIFGNTEEDRKVNQPITSNEDDDYFSIY